MGEQSQAINIQGDEGVAARSCTQWPNAYKYLYLKKKENFVILTLPHVEKSLPVSVDLRY